MDAFWPIVIIWIVLTVLGSRKKRPRAQAPAPPARADQGGARAQGGFLEEMRRALEEMQRAAEEQQRRQQPDARAAAQEEAARRYLEDQRRKAGRPARSTAQVFQPGQGRRPVVRPQRPLEDDDADKSSEDATVVSMEGVDYDLLAERVAAERAKAADRGARTEGSAEALTQAQAARRAGRVPAAIGGAAEHAAWHREIGAAPPAAAPGPSRRSPLARYADGTMRSAVILGEILGRPPGLR